MPQIEQIGNNMYNCYFGVQFYPISYVYYYPGYVAYKYRVSKLYSTYYFSKKRKNISPNTQMC